MKLIKETNSEKILECSCCGIQKRLFRVNFCKIHLGILYKVHRFSQIKLDSEEGEYVFNIKDLDREMKLTKTEYGNLNTLVRFGLLFRLSDFKRGIYGIPLKRVKDFLNGDFAIADSYWKDSVTKEIELSENRVKINEIAHYKNFLEENGLPSFVEYN